MKIFNGIYSWDGKRHGSREPIAWFPGAYSLRIINLEKKQGKVAFLKPFLCIYSETGNGHSISANPEKFVKHVCDDFNLELERVLWVEHSPSNPPKYEVIVFTRSTKVGETTFYEVRKRAPSEAERKLIVDTLEMLEA